jgi:hypothetical protein
MRRRTVIAATLVGLLQLAVVLTLVLGTSADTTHRAPLVVVAPPVVATAIVDQANGLAGAPVDAQIGASDGAARRAVRDGDAVAAVLVDLRRETDTVLVAGARGSRLNDVVADQVRTFERTFGRDVRLVELVPARAGDAGQRWAYAAVGAWLLVGFVIALVVTWRRGPVAASFRLGARRLLACATVAVGAALLIGATAAVRYDGGFAAWWLAGALAVFTVTATTLALESLFGVMGIGAATALFILTGAPLVRLASPWLLPEPWAAVTPWLPHGAALELASGQAYFGGPELRPVLVLVAWTALALLTMVVARRERPAGVLRD